MRYFVKFLILSALSLTVVSWAQRPVKHRSVRQHSFPASLPVAEAQQEWQRNVYRELNLKDSENQCLWSPSEPDRLQQGLFMKIFSLALDGSLPVYKHSLDGNEVFSSNTRADFLDILSNHHIYFEKDSDRILVDRSDIPASEVMTYYIKEAVYYDLRNSSFRTRVLAVCPVLVENDEFSDGPVKYPLFWVEYCDLEPYLSEINVIPDYRNRASVMSLTDYFELGMYKGVIYKVDNAFGHTLLQGADSDSVVNAERQRIELELRSVRRPVFNVYHHN